MKSFCSLLKKIFKRKKRTENVIVNIKTKKVNPTKGLVINTKNSLPWSRIIIHHSATKDYELNDWKSIKRYHTSYRIDSKIVSKKEFYKRKQKKQGIRFEKPYKDIGYNFGIEIEKGQLVYRIGRPLSINAAHCYQDGNNRKAIGICVVGNYDKQEPTEDRYWWTACLCKKLMKLFKIPIENIYPHRYFAHYKSCPGNLFDMDKLKSMITEV